MTAPLTMSIEPLVPDQVAVPLLFSVREESTTFEDAGKVMPRCALSVAFAPVTQLTPVIVEHMVPPDQVNAPLASISPVPPKLPPVTANGPLIVSWPLNARVPPFMLIALATELFVTLKGPDEKVIVPELFSPLMLRSEEHTSELQSHSDLVCRLLLEKKKK